METDDPAGPLLARVSEIEALALEERAAAFADVHDALQAMLENADAPRHTVVTGDPL